MMEVSAVTLCGLCGLCDVVVADPASASQAAEGLQVRTVLGSGRRTYYVGPNYRIEGLEEGSPFR